MFNEVTAIKIEFRIPEIYWGDGLLIVDDYNFHGLIADDLIVGSINPQQGLEFDMYLSLPSDKDDDVFSVKHSLFKFKSPMTALFLSNTFNIQGKNSDDEIIIAVFTTKDICTDVKLINFTEESILKLQQEFGL